MDVLQIDRKTSMNTMRMKLIIILALFAPAAGAWAQARNDQHIGKSLPPRQTHTDEHLVMPLFPAGWNEKVAQKGAIDLIEYVPKEQSLAAWSEKITLEVHHDTNTLPLDAFQRRALGQMRANCDGVIEGRLQSGLNNGFPSAFWNLGCKRDRRGNFGETRYTKAIQGSDTLYLLTHAWRTPPFSESGPALSPQTIEAVVTFLTSSVVCANGAQHPCPTMPPTKK